MNKKEFEKFYDQNLNKVYRFIFLKVSSKEIAQDITSEAFLRLLNTIRADKKVENPRAFLYQITRNLITDFYRSKSKEALPLEEAAAKADNSQRPDVLVAMSSDMANVQKALGQIPREYSDIIIWHYLDDLSVSEIAHVLDRPEGTIRVMLHRGLSSLKSKIQSPNIKSNPND